MVFLAFAAGFLVIDSHRDDKVGRVAALAYLLGALAFVGDILFPTSESIIIRTTIAALYAGTAVFIVGAINLYYRKNFPWRFCASFVVLHLSLYAALLYLGMDWMRSLSANIGCGLIFLLGMLRIRGFMTNKLDKWLLSIGLINAATCIIRPVGLIFLSGGTFASTTHSETLMITTLHVFLACSAVLTAMSVSIVLIKDIFKTLEDQSESDPLTGLLNRRGFEKYAEQILSAPINKIATLAVFDLDHFKLVNDNHGHAAGDKVIQNMADLLKGRTTDQTIAARLGGEEFVLLISGMALTGVKQQANAICEAFRAIEFELDNDIVNCTTSIGVAEYKTNETLYSLLSRADDALYLAKNDGRNRVRCELDIAVRELKTARVSLENAANQIEADTSRTRRIQ